MEYASIDRALPADTSEKRVLSEQAIPEDEHGPESIDKALRPTRFDDYPGQPEVKENLKVYVGAAKSRDLPLDHVLLHGPPGLGKTTLARILASELGVSFYQTSGPSIEKPGDLAGVLAGLDRGAVLFIDEVHRLSITVEEILYSAMEDFCVDILVGQGPTARTVRMPIHPFTLVGATTRMANLSAPLVSRFGIQERLEFYNDEALIEILQRHAKLSDIGLSDDGAEELARRSRGTPRIANRLLRRVRDFADYYQKDVLDREIVAATLKRLDIDSQGLDRMDRRILLTIRDRYSGGPVGVETLAATVGEQRSTIEDVYEPYLMFKGLLMRGPRGRQLSAKGLEHLKAFGVQV